MKIVFAGHELLEAPDYRCFLSVLYKTNKSKNSQFSYTYIAKQCGFSSKGFVKDVIDSKKNISVDSAHKFIIGLSLPRIWGDYFLNLVLIEKTQNNNEQEKLIKENIRLKERILNLKSLVSEKSVDKYFAHQQWPYVYAALGNPQRGASAIEIQNRTSLDYKTIDKILDFLVSEKLAIRENDRFIATSNSAFFQNLGASGFFRQYFLKSIFNIQQKSQKNFTSNNALFYTISVSVSSAKMPQLKQELADLFDKFTTQIESPDGDKVAELTCGFHII